MDLELMLQQQGLLLTLASVFLGGLAMNLTPCVYPMIPITVSYFGGMGGRRTWFPATLFVLGLAITYSLLGVAAAMSGKLFGASLSNPWMVGFVSVVMVAMGLSLMGVFQLRASSGLLSAIQNQRDKMGWMGALFFGLVAGIVMAPCVGPFIVSLLAYVAAKRDPLMGFWLFFTLALGMGLPYLLLGTFAGALKSMPRPGIWMVWLEKVFGFVLIGFAIWLWRPFIPDAMEPWILGGYVGLAGLYLGFIDRTAANPWLKRSVGTAALVVAVWLVLPLAAPAPTPGVPTLTWQPWTPSILAEAKAAGKPVVIDYYAEWCAACNELDHKTWSDPEVARAAQRFVMVRVDLTKNADDDLENLPQTKGYDLKGLPTVLFLGPDGQEVKALRLEQFEAAQPMAQRLSKVP